MTPAPDLWLFFLLVFGVILLPGMDMAYVATNALVGGVRPGLTAVAGIMAGGLVHVAVASTGIAVLLTLWPAAFNAVLLGGAAYMGWIGWSLWRAARASGAASASAGCTSGSAPGSETGTASRTAPRRASRVFGRALLTCLLNPKAYAFTLAVFPAFIRQDQRPVALQALLMAAIVVATQAGVYGSVAVAAAATRRAVGPSARTERTMLRATAVLLVVGAAVTLALGWKH